MKSKTFKKSRKQRYKTQETQGALERGHADGSMRTGSGEGSGETNEGAAFPQEGKKYQTKQKKEEKKT